MTADSDFRRANQVITWFPEHVLPEEERTGHGQFLRCLKDTVPGDRQIVWESRHGEGIIGVVDFGDYSRAVRRGLYERWGRFTPLSPPVSRERVLEDKVLRRRFAGSGAKALQGNAIRLAVEEAVAIDKLASGLPPPNRPDDRPGKREEVIEWTGKEGLPAEVLIETAAANDRTLWRKLGFPERPRTQVGIPGAGRPDLLAPGVVGDAKRRVRRGDGPAQIERYLVALSAQQPEHAPWRGVLLQHADDLDNAARRRLEGSKFDVSVYSVWRTRRWHVGRLFP